MTCSNNSCTDTFGCANACADFIIKRYSTKPSFEVIVEDCNSPIDLTDAVLEVSMWLTAKFKQDIESDDTYFALADNIGFEQCNIGDILVVDRVRFPEQMLIIGFDETNKLIEVTRGYNGTNAYDYKKGTKVRIFRFLNAVGETQMTLRDIPQEDGSVDTDVLVESKLVYDWSAADTCLPGCYFLEMKLVKMSEVSFAFDAMSLAPSIVPSFISYTPSQVPCSLGHGVDWIRRFPEDRDGFLVQIMNSPVENG